MKKPMLLTLSVVGSLALILSGCQDNTQTTTTETPSVSQEETTPEYTFSNNEFFTSIEELKNFDDTEHLVIIDARPASDYEKAHIPGAINVEWQALAKMEGNPGDKDWGTLQDAETLSTTLGNLGINEDSKVIVYANDSGWGEDGRVVWSLKRAGMNARMLNGGFDLWSSRNEETSKEIPEITPVTTTVSSVSDDFNITTDDLKANYDDYVIIDTREEDEYNGATKFGEARGGHLPGAKNIVFNRFYHDDGTIKNVDEIVSIMDEAGINKDDAIITYCTGGIRSAHMAMALVNAGYTNVRNYDSSFYEWAADPSNPLE